MNTRLIAFLLFCSFSLPGVSQSGSPSDTGYLKLPWKQVATRMPAEWYASEEAKKVAENVLFCQQDIGGWAKNRPYHHHLSPAVKEAVQKNKGGIGATIDNGATITEIRFLARMYQATQDRRYFVAIERGLQYLLSAQYPNGGWPQFYPHRKGSTSYASHITFNDDAMVNVLRLLKDIAEDRKPVAGLPVAPWFRQKAKQAFDKGIACILNAQIRVNGVPTVWCAQHDEETLQPAKARAYELPSFSGQESEGIVRLLMEIKDPSAEVISSVKYAMTWFDQHKITGIRVLNRPGADRKRNIVMEKDANAPALLARFYDLETGKPFFCDRDGVKRASLDEIGAERRNGYSWYNDEYEELLQLYKAWTLKLPQ